MEKEQRKDERPPVTEALIREAAGREGPTVVVARLSEQPEDRARVHSRLREIAGGIRDRIAASGGDPP